MLRLVIIHPAMRMRLSRRGWSRRSERLIRGLEGLYIALNEQPAVSDKRVPCTSESKAEGIAM